MKLSTIILSPKGKSIKLGIQFNPNQDGVNQSKGIFKVASFHDVGTWFHNTIDTGPFETTKK